MNPDLFDLVVELLEALAALPLGLRASYEARIYDDDDDLLGTYRDPVDLAHELLSGTDVLDLYVAHAGEDCPVDVADFASVQLREET